MSDTPEKPSKEPIVININLDDKGVYAKPAVKDTAELRNLGCMCLCGSQAGSGSGHGIAEE